MRFRINGLIVTLPGERPDEECASGGAPNICFITHFFAIGPLGGCPANHPLTKNLSPAINYLDLDPSSEQLGKLHDALQTALTKVKERRR